MPGDAGKICSFAVQKRLTLKRVCRDGGISISSGNVTVRDISGWGRWSVVVVFSHFFRPQLLGSIAPELEFLKTCF